MNILKYFRWTTAEMFFILSIFVAVLFGIYGSDIQSHNNLSTVGLSIISGTFFIVFSISQFFSGILIYKIPPKLFLSGSAILSSVGCLLFANTSLFGLLILSRILLGLGLGCAFLSVIFTIQSNFAENKFVFLMSISQCIANIFVGLLGIASSDFLSRHSYIFSFDMLAGLLFIIGLGLLVSFHSNTANTDNKKPVQQSQQKVIHLLKEILLQKSFWFAVFFFTGLFSGILTFSDLYNVSYQMETFNISHENAIKLNSMIPMGIAVGGVIAGHLSSRYQNNQLIAILFSAIALTSIILILYTIFPEHYRLEICYIVMFFFGIGCGSAILAFEEIRLTMADIRHRMLANSLILTIAYLFNGLILQPLIGFIIDHLSTDTIGYYPVFSANYMRWLYDNSVHTAWYKYHNGLTLITIVLMMSFIASIFFSKKATHKDI